jgi:hypothetical protein
MTACVDADKLPFCGNVNKKTAFEFNLFIAAACKWPATD